MKSFGMLIWATWRLGVSVFVPLARAFAGYGGSSHMRDSADLSVARPALLFYGLIANYRWYDPGNITWTLLLTGIAAAGTAFWATVLRRQVHAKTSELRLSLEAQGKARHFDVARNEVLENIARNLPLRQNMERLALAIEEQISACVCAIVMPPDGKSFHNRRPSPLLIAPSISEELHPEMLTPISSLLPADENDCGSGSANDGEVIATLLGVLQNAGLPFTTSRMTVVFSGNGEAAGLLILFLQRESSDANPAEDSIVQSASRLVSLAGDHCRMHERLLHEARHDGLTGLPNRAVAEDRLEQALARAERRRKQFAVFCIDLDGFKSINDELGHDAGDEILRDVSARLRNGLRHSDTLARMGGDEFLVLIEDCAGPSAAQAVAQSLISALQEPFLLDKRQLRVSASIGIALYPANGMDAAQLRRNADLAMYRAKSLGGSQVALWSSESAPTAKAVKKSSTA
jgi:diguanylate cyclase (GGDEF)-like protein